MASKKTLYPKTTRIKIKGDTIQLTEKLDGSNLVFYKQNGELHIAQRSNIFTLSQLEEAEDKLYKGLYVWLQENGKDLEMRLCDNSAICGEWLGMGNVKYEAPEFDKKWYMFAKANITEDTELIKLNYDHTHFIYPFIEQEIPSYLGVVPIVANIRILPNKEDLDKIYDEYCEKVGGRKVEGFVLNYLNSICKYVRLKDGKLTEYSDQDHKGDC